MIAYCWRSPCSSAQCRGAGSPGQPPCDHKDIEHNDDALDDKNGDSGDVNDVMMMMMIHLKKRQVPQ